MSGTVQALLFEPVLKSDPFFHEVSKLFESTIAPIYGDQTQALEKIGEGVDRRCEVLVDQSNTAKKIVGLLVYKLNPTDEFLKVGAPKALEIKTLFVVDAKTNSGKGLGTMLFERVSEVASDKKFSSIVVTVSETKPEVLVFFSKRGFRKIDELTDKFANRELVLMKSIRV